SDGAGARIRPPGRRRRTCERPCGAWSSSRMGEVTRETRAGEAPPPHAGSHARLALEEPAEVVLALEAAAERDFLDAQGGLPQEGARAAQPDLDAVLMWAEARMVREHPPEPGVADTEVPRQRGHGGRGTSGIAHAAHGLVDGAPDVAAALLARLLRRVQQGHYVQRGGGGDL